MSAPLRVYFDGLCPLCAREIAVYQRRSNDGRIAFIDITEANFSAEAEGLDAKEVNRRFHAKDGSGTIFTGPLAFVEIWKRIPAFGFAVRLAGLPGAGLAMQFGYWGFMNLRPFLPRLKRADSCDTGHCAT
jgi:predicted DCC family thiol-disulfide oxidoreductase YuxK